MIHVEALRLTAILFQDAGVAVPVSSKLFMVFVGLVAISVLFQTIAVVGMAIGAAKTQKEVLKIANEMRAKSVPVLEISRNILEDTAPKVRVITDNIAEASFLLRDQAQRLDHAVASTLHNVQTQVQRVDNLVASTLDGVEEITHSVKSSVMVPVKQVAAMMTGLKAAIEKLTGSRFPRNPNAPDEDYFV